MESSNQQRTGYDTFILKVYVFFTYVVAIYEPFQRIPLIIWNKEKTEIWKPATCPATADPLLHDPSK